MIATMEVFPMASAQPGPESERLAGTLHFFVAFDWGDEVRLNEVSRLVPAAVQKLPRRPRTPSSIEYRPPPLRLEVAPVALPLPGLGTVLAPTVLTLFDFAAVSVALQIPFQLPLPDLRQLAACLAAPQTLVQTVRQAIEPLYRKLLPAIDSPSWSDLTEEYIVFQLPPSPTAAELLHDAQASWLASLVRLESGPLSAEECVEALRLHLSYSPTDLFVADWPAAVLFDRDCEDTLQVIEFANLQLLEYRHIDDRLDDDLATTSRLLQKVRRTWLPFWRTHARRLRSLGELRVEASGLFERTVNVLKLVGDPYLARIYRLLAARFHLDQWEQSIQRKLETLEGAFRTLSDQAATYRAEFLEWVIIALILLEVVLTLTGH
jgi:hypothetical protein